MQSIIIDNKKCNIYAKSNKAPVFIYINESSIPIGISQIIESLETINKSSHNYILIEVFIDNWDANLSPWPLKEISNRDFKGNGPQTLEWLINNIIPYINTNFKEHSQIFLAGYSLSGLFALWAQYETDFFDGIICCSGSLWFPRWDKYIEKKVIKKECFVYLSLGGKEERTKNPLVSSVGENTRKELKSLKDNSFIQSAILEMNPGGHFSDTAMRVAKGIYWILKEIDFQNRFNKKA